MSQANQILSVCMIKKVNVVMNPISQNNSMEFKVGKRYKWNPYVHGTNLWKNGILERIEDKNGHRVGHFITRDGEEWSIPIDNEDCNVKPYK